MKVFMLLIFGFSVSTFANSNQFNDPLYFQQHYLEPFKLAESHKMSRGKGIIIGVIDNGFYSDDPDLKDTYLQTHFKLEGAWHHPGTACSSHGSLVSTIIAAKDNNNNGFVGIAPDAKILRVSIGTDHRTFLNCKKASEGLTEEETQKLLKLISNSVESNNDHKLWMNTLINNFPSMVKWLIDNGAQIINISLTLSPLDSLELQPVRKAIEYAKSRGVIVIAASGNFSGVWDQQKQDWINPWQPEMRYDQVMYPAAYPWVISAGGYFKSEKDQSVQSYSGKEVGLPTPYDQLPVRLSTMHGKRLDFVLSTNENPIITRNNDGTFNYSTGRGGTSDAAPQLSAIFALMKAKFPKDSPLDLKNRLIQSSSNQGIHDFLSGFGSINLLKALSSSE